MGPTWVLSTPYGPHVDPMNLAIRAVFCLNHERQQYALLLISMYIFNSESESFYQSSQCVPQGNLHSCMLKSILIGEMPVVFKWRKLSGMSHRNFCGGAWLVLDGHQVEDQTKFWAGTIFWTGTIFGAVWLDIMYHWTVVPLAGMGQDRPTYILQKMLFFCVFQSYPSEILGFFLVLGLQDIP